MSAHNIVGDIPDISWSSYGTTTHDLGAGFGGGYGDGVGWGGPGGVAGHFTTSAHDLAGQFHGGGRTALDDRNIVRSGRRLIQDHPPQEQTLSTRRLVQVFIVDPDVNVPLDAALIYSGKQKFTDATDQELFFEIDINSHLAAHNKIRSEIMNKSVKERTEYLEPIKIRDLKMVVVNIAQF